MSDEQRGPYTPSREGPPREAPLQFDARGARDARPMPMTLIASGVVLVVLIGGVIMAYAGGFHKKDDPTKPVGDRVLVMKTAPAGGVTAPADQTVALNGSSANPTFTAPPEQPVPRPQLQLRQQTLPPVRIAAGDEEAVASGAKPSTPTSTLLPTTRTVTTAAKTTTTVTTPKATSTIIAAKTVTPEKPIRTSTAVSAGSAGVQIGAFSSHDLADKGFADAGKLVSTSGHGKRIEAVERNGSTLYRTTVTGFADRDEAKAFCEQLTAKGHACIVKG